MIAFTAFERRLHVQIGGSHSKPRWSPIWLPDGLHVWWKNRGVHLWWHGPNRFERDMLPWHEATRLWAEQHVHGKAPSWAYTGTPDAGGTDRG